MAWYDIVLCQAAQADPQLSGDQFKVGSEAHRLRIRAWQGLASAVAFLTSPAQQQAAAEALAGDHVLASWAVALGRGHVIATQVCRDMAMPCCELLDENDIVDIACHTVWCMYDLALTCLLLRDMCQICWSS